jgi:formylmethanofuran dehydrogenase subunit D
MTLEVTLITGRSIAQGEAMETGKKNEAYTNSVAVCELDHRDMKKLGVREGETVRVATESGEVLVKAVRSTQEPHPGIVFIPLGPWANAVVNPDTTSTGMPSYKGMKATINPARDKKVLSAIELVRERYLKR